MVASTSAKAYNENKSNGVLVTQIDRITSFMKSSTESQFTRRQISMGTGLELGAVAGRVNEMIKSELARDCGVCVDPITEKHVKMVELLLGGQR